jgi:glycosyltransferase involved in cell wall biosynthesis
MAHSPRQPIAFLSIATDPSGLLEAGKTSPEAYYLRKLGEALVKLGWQVDLFTIKNQTHQLSVLEHTDYLRTIRLPGPIVDDLTKLMISNGHQPTSEDQPTALDHPLFQTDSAPWSLFFQAFQNFQAKEGTNYPLIHTSDWISGWVGWQLKQQSSVQWVHTAYARVRPFGLAEDLTTHNDLRFQIEQKIWKQADQIVATIPLESGRRSWPLNPSRPLEVIPCGTDTQHFHTIPRLEARTKLNLQPHRVILLYVGQFAPHKGLSTLISACAALRKRGIDFDLILAGEESTGPASEVSNTYSHQIQQQVAEQNLTAQTHFPGHIDHDHLPYYYAAADACIIPSHYEPFGWVAIEAMACGTPVIASNVGGLRLTIAHEETGLLVPPQDAEALAAAIQRVLSDPVWANTLRQLSSNRAVQHFSWTRVAAQLSDLYRRLLAQSLMGSTLSVL